MYRSKLSSDFLFILSWWWPQFANWRVGSQLISKLLGLLNLDATLDSLVECPWRSTSSAGRSSSLRRSQGRRFNCMMRLICCNLLHSNLLLESIHHIFSIDPFNFYLSILLNELINVHVTTANSDHDFVALLDLDEHSFLPKLVNAFRLPEEHNIHLFSLWISVDKSAESSINHIAFVCNIDGLLFFKQWDFM